MAAAEEKNCATVGPLVGSHVLSKWHMPSSSGSTVVYEGKATASKNGDTARRNKDAVSSSNGAFV
ncbi:hypothetical protein E2562_001901 [Oryza meyeriana var. granulata]|uniref:Uncharacterized protein n=1 Tax=Oryza meyeriana var. granulata TaxID=110450 RepID=A0A6G1C355_9ORYZ|nr:hypothetical protein E2562_001901 [Oryza meyeriana var. granulata]